MPLHPTRLSFDVRRAVVVAAGIALVAASASACSKASGAAKSTGAANAATSSTASNVGSTAQKASNTKKPAAFKLLSITPKNGSQSVATNAPVDVKFTDPVAVGTPKPKISPAVAGTWSKPTPSTLRFIPKAPWPLATAISVTVTPGTRGTHSVYKQTLAEGASTSFATAGMSTLRVQQLLAELNYLPVRFIAHGATRPANAMAMAQPGTFHWKWGSAQNILSSQWAASSTNEVTTAALMDFQRQHNLDTVGTAGPLTEAALIKDAIAHKLDPDTYDYVLVTKVLPENLTLYVNGVIQLANLAVNTGVSGADTEDGTFATYSHSYSSEMRGTDVDGSTYDVICYWVSYFDGGEALHAYPRSYYGAPASNGCVEMDTANAQALYPYTPIGTLVTVVG
jgi:peptidoglycan hydrolase-like protein with peptidoglycan-binding domain